MDDVEQARFEVSEGTGALTGQRDSWDKLAALRPSPFLTHGWLVSWAQAHPDVQVQCATLRTPSGRLLAGALLRRVRGGLASAASGHEGGDWDVVAVDMAARRRMWEELAQLRPSRFFLSQMRAGSPEVTIAREALAQAGYGVLPSVRELRCPYVNLPSTYEELLASRSRNARQQIKRRQRDLNRAGQVRLRIVTGGPKLDRDFDAFLAVEASGWKGREGTAIANRPERESLYRSFVHEMAERGWLRLHLLELDGILIAASLVVSIGTESFSMKAGFDESYSRLGPGSTLMAEEIRVACEEGLRGMDLLGRMDQYKMRWADEIRPRQRLRVYRGPVGLAAQRVWATAVRPALVTLRDRAREDDAFRSYLERAQQLVRRPHRSP